MRHASPSFDHVVCMAKVPVVNVTLSIRPGPSLSHMHLSAFSWPLPSYQPPNGNWSVITSEYSCPSTIVTPSSNPGVPGFRNDAPQLFPASGMYGRFVNARSPKSDGEPTNGLPV